VGSTRDKADQENAARGLYRALLDRHIRLACAESCTGGLVTAAITDIPGSSEVLWGGIAAYSNECKSALLGIEPGLIAEFGAVSREVAAAMAEGALAASGAELSLAITGIAGPGGGSTDKPVGLVWFAWRSRDGRGTEESLIFQGDRAAVRQAAATHAIKGATRLALSGDARY